MSPASMILLMISAWFLVAAAMLWGMLRLVRRAAYQRPPTVIPQAPAVARAKRKIPRVRPAHPLPAQAFRAAQHYLQR